MSDRSAIGYLALVVSSTLLSWLLLGVERMRMKALEVPDTISLSGFDTLVAAISNFEALLVSFLVIALSFFALALGLFCAGFLVAFFALVIGLTAVLLWACLRLLAFLSIDALVYLYDTLRQLFGRVKWVEQGGDAPDTAGPMPSEKPDQIERFSNSLDAWGNWIIALYKSANVAIIAGVLCGLDVLFFDRTDKAKSDGKDSKPGRRSRLIAPGVVVVVMVFLAFASTAAWNSYVDRDLRGTVGQSRDEVMEVASRALGVLEYIEDCDNRPSWVPKWGCDLSHGFPLVHLTVSKSIESELTQLIVEAQSPDGSASFRTEKYFYLGDFGDWAFLAEHEDPSRRFLVRRSHIVEISEADVRPDEIVTILTAFWRARQNEAMELLRALPTIVLVTSETNVAAPDLSGFEELLAQTHESDADFQERLMTELKQIGADIGARGQSPFTERQVNLATVFQPTELVFDFDLTLGRILNAPADTPHPQTIGMAMTRQPSAAFVEQCLATDPHEFLQVSFNENSTRAPNAIGEITKLVSDLRARTPAADPMTLLVTGSASYTGDPIANLIVSERRAEHLVEIIREGVLGRDTPDPAAAASALQELHKLTLLAAGLGEHPNALSSSPRNSRILDCSGIPTGPE